MKRKSIRVYNLDDIHKITKINLREHCNSYVWNSTIIELERAIIAYNALSDPESPGAKRQLLEIFYNAPLGLNFK